MSLTNVFQIFLLTATFLCTVVFGFLLVFDIVVMPGIGRLDDRDFLRAFIVIDGVIQDNQPMFVFVWIASVLSLLTTAGIAIEEWKGSDRLPFIIIAAVLNLVAQATTFGINVPMNNRVQSLDFSALDYGTAKVERDLFEGPWNKWNKIRLALFGCVSLYLLVVVLLETSSF